MKNKKNCYPISDSIIRKGSTIKTIGFNMATNLSVKLQTCKHQIKYTSTKKKIRAVIIALLIFFGSFSFKCIY